MSLWFLSVLGAGHAGSASALAHAFRADGNEANDRYRHGEQVFIAPRSNFPNSEIEISTCAGNGKACAQTFIAYRLTPALLAIDATNSGEDRARFYGIFTHVSDPYACP